MGRRRDKEYQHRHLPQSRTLPSSPTHSFSSSSSDFEFTISLSPHKSPAALCPADELFYKGQILPLQLSPRRSMVRTLFLTSSSSSSFDTTTTASRDSTGSSTDSYSSFSSSDLSLLQSYSSRPSSADQEFKCTNSNVDSLDQNSAKKSSKYFSLSKLSSVFRKEPKNSSPSSSPLSSPKPKSRSAKEVISKYLKKVKPFYEKISQRQHQLKSLSSTTPPASNPTLCMKTEGSYNKERNPNSIQENKKENSNSTISHDSFAGNMGYPRRRSNIASCPSSIRSSPNHSGIHRRNGFSLTNRNPNYADTSSMEELQSAIQGAIAHCKNSLLQNDKTMVSNEI